MNRRMLLLLATSSLLIVVLFSTSIVYYRSRVSPAPRTHILTPGNETRLETVDISNSMSAFVDTTGEYQLTVMDFSEPMALDPVPPGWWHRRFLTRAPMDMSFGRVGGRHALRLATENSASMLFRYVDIDLQRYPLLSWSWLIEEPIESELDENTRAGDDHPARLYVRFEDASGLSRSLEIIWGNDLAAGDSKFIGGFPHYVANGGNDNLRRWQEEEVNLLELYLQFWPDTDPDVRITDIALFCDSDETGDDSVAWFGRVRMKQQLGF
ncbi:MAG: hypothetical protein PsegKO_29450 [Pseudohongiellaceae bacterium]